ncbi:MAG: UPF0280 family protein [Candidatus Geothermincolia bacterium]
MERFYRDRMRADDLVSFQVVVEETDLMIWAAREMRAEAEAAVRTYRGDIESFIERNPRFRGALAPYPVTERAPVIVRVMAAAGAAVGVGPMAAVAGAMAEFVGLLLARAGSPRVIVENGGDIFLVSDEERHIGVFAGESPFSGRLTLRVPPAPTGLGICTSSATVGPSLSLGRADAALVISDSAAFADAAASALGNRVKRASDVEAALDWLAGFPQVRGALVIIGETLGARGEVSFLEPENGS